MEGSESREHTETPSAAGRARRTSTQVPADHDLVVVAAPGDDHDHGVESLCVGEAR